MPSKVGHVNKVTMYAKGLVSFCKKIQICTQVVVKSVKELPNSGVWGGSKSIFYEKFNVADLTHRKQLQSLQMI